MQRLPIDHVGTVVPSWSDLRWWTNVLQWPVDWWETPTTPDAATIGLPGEEVRLRGAVLRASHDDARRPVWMEVHQFLTPQGHGYRRPDQTGLSHVALRPVDIWADWERLRQTGVTWFSEPQEIKAGALAGHAWVWGLSPDGTPIELHSDGGPAPSRLILDHVGITVADLDAAERFLSRAFGWDVIWREDPTTIAPGAMGVPEPLSLRGIGLDTGSCRVELHEFAPTKLHTRRTCDTGLGHFAVWADDMEAAHAHLAEAGVMWNTGPRMIDAGGLKGHWWTYGTMPDAAGVVIQTCQHPDPPASPIVINF